MKHCTQRELIDLLKSNPFNVDVFLNEVTVPNASDYIFVDRLSDVFFAYDNKAFYVNEIQIQVYCDDFNKFNGLIKFIKSHFIGNVDIRKEDHFNVSTLVTQLVVLDWNEN